MIAYFKATKHFFEFYKKGHLLILLIKDIYYVKNSQKSVSLNYVCVSNDYK